MTMLHGTDSLQAPFFEQVCREVFEPWLKERGFTRSERTRVGGVRFFRDSVFLEVTYYPEEFPLYSPMVTVGLLEQADGRILQRRVGLWRVIENASLENSYSLWKFGSESEARLVFTRIRDEILPKYAEDLWSDPSRIQELSANSS